MPPRAGALPGAGVTTRRLASLRGRKHPHPPIDPGTRGRGCRNAQVPSTCVREPDVSPQPSLGDPHQPDLEARLSKTLSPWPHNEQSNPVLLRQVAVGTHLNSCDVASDRAFRFGDHR
jgi:hypothetical protein